MKKLNFLFSTIALSVLTLTSCTKEEIKPVNNQTEVNQTKSVMLPQILANTVVCEIGKGGASKFNVGFNQVTANVFGSTVYARYRVSGSTGWSTPIAMTSFSNPNGVYVLNVALAHNIVLDVQFIDSPSATITSPIYIVTTP